MTTRLAAVLIAVLALTGCGAAASPYDTAWEACVDMNTALHPDGVVDARDGQTLDAEEICHSTVATQGKDRFTALFNDAAWVECFSDAGRVAACDPPD